MLTRKTKTQRRDKVKSPKAVKAQVQIQSAKSKVEWS